MAEETKEASQSIVPDFGKITDLQIHDGKPPVAEPTLEKTDAVTSKDADGQDDPDEGLEDKNNTSATAEDSTTEEETETEEEGIEISEEDLDDFISQRFDGKYKSVSEIEEKLARLDELEKDPTPKFQSERHKKLYEFVSKYGKDDFGTGIQNFARLQSIEDVTKLSAKDALKELFIQENPDLSREDAELVFEDDFERKDPDKIEDERAQKIARIKLDKEASAAKEKLTNLKSETITENNDSKNEEIAQKITEFKSNVETATADFDRITIHADENNPDSAFNYDFDNTPDIAKAMTDWDFHCQKMEWVDSKGNINFDKMKLDYAFLYNSHAIIQNSIHHGKELGKEELLREMAGKEPKKKESNASGKINKTKEDAFKDAVLSLPGK